MSLSNANRNDRDIVQKVNLLLDIILKIKLSLDSIKEVTIIKLLPYSLLKMSKLSAKIPSSLLLSWNISSKINLSSSNHMIESNKSDSGDI